MTGGLPGVPSRLPQLALDPLVAPAGVLSCHLLDQHCDLGVNARASSLVRIGPPPVDQPPVPAQQRARRHQSAHPQRPREQPRLGGEHNAVGPLQPWPSGSAATARRSPGAIPAVRHPSMLASASKPAFSQNRADSRPLARWSSLVSLRDRACGDPVIAAFLRVSPSEPRTRAPAARTHDPYPGQAAKPALACPDAARLPGRPARRNRRVPSLGQHQDPAAVSHGHPVPCSAWTCAFMCVLVGQWGATRRTAPYRSGGDMAQTKARTSVKDKALYKRLRNWACR